MGKFAARRGVLHLYLIRCMIPTFRISSINSSSQVTIGFKWNFKNADVISYPLSKLTVKASGTYSNILVVLRCYSYRTVLYCIFLSMNED